MAINTELTDADTPATAHASRVLVVYDERSMRELLSIVLRRDGYDVLVAHLADVRARVEVVRSHAPVVPL